MPFSGSSLLTTIALIVALLVALQCGYLIGLALSHIHMTARARARLSHAHSGESDHSSRRKASTRSGR
jgi:hypothetical protein